MRQNKEAEIIETNFASSQQARAVEAGVGVPKVRSEKWY